MTEPADVIARKLAHDVGKYVSRAARNLPSEGAIPQVLIEMLRRDVFGGPHDGAAPSSKFETLAASLAITDARLAEVRARFAHARSLEAAVGAGAEDAVRSVAADALAIEHALMSLARDLSKPGART